MLPMRRHRLWAPALVLAIAAGALVWIWTDPEPQRQDRVLATGAVALGAGVLVLAWLVFLSRLRWWARVAGLVVAVVAVVAVGVLVEVRGVSGDLVPVLGWRFGTERTLTIGMRPPPEEAMANPPLQAWPGFLGPRRDATVTNVELEADWAAHPPRLVWERQVGEGWSGFAISGTYAVTQEQQGGDELVTCYALANGFRFWSHAEPARYETTIAGIGPRATPEIVGDRVVALGATGRLVCLELASGELLWSRDVLADHGGSLPEWGMAGSPLVVDDLVIVAAGGPGKLLAAYALEDGEPRWTGGDDRPGYSSPGLFELAGTRQLLSLNASSLSSHDPATGEVLWSTPWSDKNPNVAQPVAVGPDELVISSGYGVGAARYAVARADDGSFSAELRWKTRALKAKFANFVRAGGHLYGLDDGILACVDAEDGRRVWKGGRYGHGQLLLVGRTLLGIAEDGELFLVVATPEEHRELARAPALDDKVWNTIAFAPPYLVVRNDREARCFELALATR